MPSKPRRDAIVLPILLTCLAYACYNVNDAAIKQMARHMHFSELIFVNAILAIIVLSTYGWLKEGKRAFMTKKWKHIAARATLSQATSVCNILALPHLQLTTFYTIVFTSPFIVALLSTAFLGERPGKRRLGVILAGFAVVLAVFRPGSGLFDVWTLMALAGATFYSGGLVLIRNIMRSPGESRTFIFLASSVVGLAWTAPLLPAHFIMPSPFEWGLFVGSNLLSFVALLAIGRAFAISPTVSLVAPFHYTQIVWAALIGWMFFHETPDARVMTGAAAIIALGLYLIFTETRDRKPGAENAARVIDAETTVGA
jgi:drug/metabolite transporter (DMT)-like permease